MKIVHVETGRHLYGGAQQVLYLITGLSEYGVESVLVCPPDSEVAPAARRQGVAVVELSCRGDLDLRFAWRLRQVLAAERPDIVHCHSRRGADVMGGQAAAMLGIPAIVSRRVDNPEPKFLAAMRYRPFRRVVAISQAIADVLVSAGLDPHKLVVIRSAVDADRFAEPVDRPRIRQRYELSPDDVAIVSAGQFIPRKGQRYLLEAIARLKDRYPQLRALLFGRGPLEADLKRRSTELGLDTHVRFPGFRADLDAELAAFDLLVHTALAEGLGVITLEAQAAGLPVVAFNAGGVGEVVAHEETGLLVPPRDVERLSEAIAELVDDSARRDRYAKAARARAREQFSVQPMVMGHLRLYESVLTCLKPSP